MPFNFELDLIKTRLKFYSPLGINFQSKLKIDSYGRCENYVCIPIINFPWLFKEGQKLDNHTYNRNTNSLPRPWKTVVGSTVDNFSTWSIFGRKESNW